MRPGSAHMFTINRLPLIRDRWDTEACWYGIKGGKLTFERHHIHLLQGAANGRLTRDTTTSRGKGGD